MEKELVAPAPLGRGQRRGLTASVGSKRAATGNAKPVSPKRKDAKSLGEIVDEIVRGIDAKRAKVAAIPE